MKRTTTVELRPESKKSRYSKKLRKTYKLTNRVNTTTHHFVRRVQVGGVNDSTLGLNTHTGFQNGSVVSNLFNLQMNFSLAGVNLYFGGATSRTVTLPSNTEFSNLYDQYRIDWVECTFYFSNNNSSVNSPATTLPLIYITKDYDDSNAAAVSDISQYSKSQVWQVGNQQGRDGRFTVRVKPCVDTQVYNGVSSGYARSKPIFIDTASNSVPHYGIKVAYDPVYDNGTGSIVGYLAIDCKYHMTMQNSK